MNITDIDDKIIKRARQNHLYEQYIEKNLSLDEVLNDVTSVMLTFQETVKTTTDPDKKNMLDKIVKNVEQAVENLTIAVKSNDENKIKEYQGLLLKESHDPLSDWLDKKHGASVTQNSIFNKLSQYWEEEYHKDMDSLNVNTFLYFLITNLNYFTLKQSLYLKF